MLSLLSNLLMPEMAILIAILSDNLTKVTACHILEVNDTEYMFEETPDTDTMSPSTSLLAARDGGFGVNFFC